MYLIYNAEGSAVLNEASNKLTTENIRHFELCVQRNVDPLYADEDQHYQRTHTIIYVSLENDSDSLFPR